LARISQEVLDDFATCIQSDVQVGGRIGPSTTSGQCPDYPRKRTSDLRVNGARGKGGADICWVFIGD